MTPDNENYDIKQIGARTVWDGANDTHILLYATWIDKEDELPDTVSNEYKSIYTFLYMTYYKGGINERLKEICRLEEQLEKEQEAHNNQGYDGL